MAERVHQRDQVAGEGAGVVPALGLVGQPQAALVDRDDLELPGQRRHQQAPGVPGLGPAVHQQQRRGGAPPAPAPGGGTGGGGPPGGRGGGGRPGGWGARRRGGGRPGGGGGGG